MSVYPGAAMGYSPPRKVNYGWIGESWSLFTANAGIWIVAVLISFLAPTILNLMLTAAFGQASTTATPGLPPAFSGLTRQLPPALNIFSNILSAAWHAFFYGGVYKMAVKQVRGEPIAFGDIFSGGGTFLSMLGFNIVFGLAVGIGFVLLIIPGLIVTALLLPAYALIADGESISTAISRSIDGMKQDLWSGVGFVVVLGLLILVSVLPCFLGLLATYPMNFLIAALAYRDMVGMPTGNVPLANPYYQQPQPGVWPPPPTQAPTQQQGIWPPPQQTPPSFGQPPAQGQTPPNPFNTAPQAQTPPNPFAAPAAPVDNPFARPADPPQAQTPPDNPFARPVQPPRTSLSGEPLDGEDKQP